MIDKEKVTFAAFYERFSEYTDDRILEILHNQKDYQEAARGVAARIAIERGLIHSEQDLLSPEFQQNRNMKRTFFPSMPGTHYHNRLIGSIFRFLFIFALLPFIYGILEYAKGNVNHAIFGVCGGCAWFLLSLALKKTQNVLFMVPLWGLLIAAASFTGYKVLTVHPIHFMDVFIFVVSVLLPSYLLIYLKKLIGSKSGLN